MADGAWDLYWNQGILGYSWDGKYYNAGKKRVILDLIPCFDIQLYYMLGNDGADGMGWDKEDLYRDSKVYPSYLPGALQA